MLKWDADSWTSFKIDKTLADYEKRFALEDEGFIDVDKPFRWSMLDAPWVQMEFETM